jgi:hypothetical protein
MVVCGLLRFIARAKQRRALLQPAALVCQCGGRSG